jgi:flagellar assembly factor FliW
MLTCIFKALFNRRIQMNMPLNTTENTLSFPHGLIGLEELTEFKLFQPESDKPTVFELQSLSDKPLILSVVEPRALDLELGINLSDEEQALLQLSNIEDAVVAVIIYKSDDEKSPIKAMVKTPIVINVQSKIAIQKTLSNADYIK